MNDIKLTLAEEVKKLLQHLQIGLFNHILISGNKEKLDDLYELLWQECQSQKMKVRLIITLMIMKRLFINSVCGKE